MATPFKGKHAGLRPEGEKDAWYRPSKAQSWGRPTKAYVSSLRELVPEDYEKMVIACVEALLSGETYVILAVSYVTKFPEGFPRTWISHAEGSIRHRKVVAKDLLEWLNKTGHTEVTQSLLSVGQWHLSRLSSNIERILDDEF